MNASLPMRDEISAQLEKACNLLIEKIRQFQPDSEGWVRLEASAPSLPPLFWLARQRGLGRYYWRDRDSQFEMAGVGEAVAAVPGACSDGYEVLSRLRRSMAPGEKRVRYYGGFRFHPPAAESDAERWSGFKGHRFVLPRIELCRSGASHALACSVNAWTDKEALIEFAAEACRAQAPREEEAPVFEGREDLPDLEAWRRLTGRALSACARGRLRKVVLARQSTFRASQKIDPVQLCAALAEAADKVYLFCFQPTEHRSFLGASPERLYRRAGAAFESEALAGTRPRGSTLEADRQLTADLLASDKEAREHQLVVSDICAVLRGHCTSVHAASGPSVVKLSRCQHLHTPIRGCLKPGVDDAALLCDLHPTPAVGGLPKKEALDWIGAEEPFERGIYAAPVGWIGADAAEFCVGIRSGLVYDKMLALYAGAGIVPGSDPDAEWRELDAKIAGFLKVIMKGDA